MPRGDMLLHQQLKQLEPPYILLVLFFQLGCNGLLILNTWIQNTSGQPQVCPDVFCQRLQVRPCSLAAV